MIKSKKEELKERWIKSKRLSQKLMMIKLNQIIYQIERVQILLGMILIIYNLIRTKQIIY